MLNKHQREQEKSSKFFCLLGTLPVNTQVLLVRLAWNMELVIE